ncbi:MAG: alanyl-tRNA editing protein [Candidatus Bathyarchaeota archaeon]|nr:MAG: alanyl-tRNA editing protein [Candidatus Bathyarchaeota archaeon]
MTETIRLFDNDPYLRKFKAKVLEIKENQIELDRTAFYPEGGGQAGDTGKVGGVEVLDTQKDDGRILHVLGAEPPFSVGDEVEAEIDWERRHLVMRLHSTAHIMEHFLWERLGKIERLGSFVDENKDRADYAYEGRLPSEDLKAVEESTNVFLAEGHEIRIDSDPAQPGLRIWRCGPIEIPCGGTHVGNTGEIGSIKLRRKNPGKGKERVETSLS